MKIQLLDPAGKPHQFECRDVIDGIPVDPVLPTDFGETDNATKPPRYMAWWGVPYIVANPPKSPKGFTCKCLDNGAWDRPTWLGVYSKLETAVESLRAVGRVDAVTAVPDVEQSEQIGLSFARSQYRYWYNAAVDWREDIRDLLASGNWLRTWITLTDYLELAEMSLAHWANECRRLSAKAKGVV